jgi:hypothetical protein
VQDGEAREAGDEGGPQRGGEQGAVWHGEPRQQLGPTPADQSGRRAGQQEPGLVYAVARGGRDAPESPPNAVGHSHRRLFDRG